MTERETIVVLDFGSQYSQLIARRVREAEVYCELIPYNVSSEEILSRNPVGYILSGGPSSVYAPGAPHLPACVLESDKPVLGICYGMQLLAYHLGGRVDPAQDREYGQASIEIQLPDSPIFRQVQVGDKRRLDVWMSHGDRITQLPPGFTILARSDNSPMAAMGDSTRALYGLQFHPEVAHTPQGTDILRAFLFDVCGCHGGWTPGNFIEESIQRVRDRVGSGRIICGLSGGVDSAVTAALLHRAVGDQLTCIFVNNGLLRLEEPEEVVTTFRDNLGIRLVPVDATEQFLADLAGTIDPEIKRKRIGERFIRIFEREATRIGPVEFLAQGTLYPDVIESTAPDRTVAAKIKTHHNVGGLPEDMKLQLVEPLRYLLKDEVRKVGLALGLPDEMVWRHPFPGPGLAVRVLGEVTWDRLETLRQADAIFLDELRDCGWYKKVAQAFAVLLPVYSVGVMGDERTYANVVALRAITTEDFMTADWARLPDELLARISSRIVNEVSGVNRVVYDVSSKPPATVEWE